MRAAPGLGVRILTLYAFSSDNWQRPASEVATLMRLFERYLRTKRDSCIENGVRLNVIGRRDRLRPAIVRAIERTEAATAAGQRLHLRLAIDYSSRDAIASAALRMPRGATDNEAFSRLLNQVIHSPGVPDVDLLIRTGGEKRLSDFLLWESAYAELVFSDRMWPDFSEADFALAVADYARRHRRFGALESPKSETSAMEVVTGLG